MTSPQRKYQITRHAAGCCVSCGKKKESKRQGRNLCVACADKRNANMRELTERRKAEGRCITCGRKKRRSHVRCKPCEVRGYEAMRRFKEKRYAKRGLDNPPIDVVPLEQEVSES